MNNEHILKGKIEVYIEVKSCWALPRFVFDENSGEMMSQ